jgi:hypothetical protein
MRVGTPWLGVAGIAVMGVIAAAACAPGPAGDPVVTTTSAILGGTADTAHDAVVAVLQKIPGATSAFACSGTTIAQDGTSAFLLTAAHCVAAHDAMMNVVKPVQIADPAAILVVPGPDWQASFQQRRTFGVTKIWVPTAFDGNSGQPGDLAVVRYETLGAAVATLPILEPVDDTLAVGSVLTLVGYGRTDPATPASVRRTVDRPIAGLSAELLSYLQNDMKGQCYGDSGGPALTRVAGVERVAGVMSYTDSVHDLGLDCLLTGTSVRVSTLAPFIHAVISGTAASDAGAQVDAVPACGTLTDPRPDCMACITNGCCAVATACAADPDCVACGARPTPECASRPRAVDFKNCLQVCPDNPCGVYPGYDRPDAYYDEPGPVTDMDASPAAPGPGGSDGGPALARSGCACDAGGPASPAGGAAAVLAVLAVLAVAHRRPGRTGKV